MWAKIIGKGCPTPANFGHTDNTNISTMACYNDKLILGVTNSQRGFKVFTAKGGSTGINGQEQSFYVTKKVYTVPELLYLKAKESMYHIPIVFGLRDQDGDKVSVTFEYQKEGGNVYEWASRSKSEVFMADQSYLLNSMDAHLMNVEGKDHRHEFLGHRCCKTAEKAE